MANPSRVAHPTGIACAMLALVLVGCGTPETPAAPAPGTMGGPSVSAGSGYGADRSGGSGALRPGDRQQPPAGQPPGGLSTLIAVDSPTASATASAVLVGAGTPGPSPAATLSYTVQKSTSGLLLWTRAHAMVTLSNSDAVPRYAYVQVTFTSGGKPVETQPAAPMAVLLAAGATQQTTFDATVHSDDVLVSLKETLF